MLSLKKKKSF